MPQVKKSSYVRQNVVHRERDGSYSKDKNALIRKSLIYAKTSCTTWAGCTPVSF